MSSIDLPQFPLPHVDTELETQVGQLPGLDDRADLGLAEVEEVKQLAKVAGLPLGQEDQLLAAARRAGGYERGQERGRLGQDGRVAVDPLAPVVADDGEVAQVLGPEQGAEVGAAARAERELRRFNHALARVRGLRRT